VVGGGHRIGHVLEIDLELAGRELRDRPFGRNVLDVAELPQAVEEGLALGEPVVGIDLGFAGAGAEPAAHRHLSHPRRVEIGIEQVELELECRDRGEAMRLEAPGDPAEQGPRVGEEGLLAAQIVEAAQDLGAGRRPGHRLQRLDVEPYRPVGVALLPDEPAPVDIRTRRVDRVERGGEDRLAPKGGIELADVEALASGDADDVGEDDVDRIDERMLG
jgi:hypothetical protein